jgi:hypothetical protein
VAWDDGPLRGMSGKYLYTEVREHQSQTAQQRP